MVARSSKQTLFVGIFFLLFSGFALFSLIIVNTDTTGYEHRMLGLLIMLLSLVVVIFSNSNTWRSSIGVMFWVALFQYHGIGELLYILFPYNRWFYEYAGTSSESLAYATFVAGIGMLAFAVGFAIINLRPSTRNYTQTQVRNSENKEAWRELLRINIWVILLWFIIALVFRSGARNDIDLTSSGTYWTRVFLLDMFVPLAILLFLLLTARSKNGDINTPLLLTFIGILVFITVILSNTRQDLLVITLVFIFLSSKWNLYRLKLGHALLGASVILILFIVLAGFRGEVGRTQITSSNIEGRINQFIDFLEFSSASFQDIDEGYTNILLDLSYRLNGNVFLGNAHVRREFTVSEIYDFNVYTVPLILIVPSFAWPQKLSLPIFMRDVEAYLENRLNILDIDYVVTPIGVFYSSGGFPVLIISMFLVGIGVAYLDRWLSRTTSQWVMIFGIGIVTGLAWVEHDITDWFVRARAGLVLAAIIYVISAFLSRKRSQNKPQ